MHLQPVAEHVIQETQTLWESIVTSSQPDASQQDDLHHLVSVTNGEEAGPCLIQAWQAVSSLVYIHWSSLAKVLLGMSLKVINSIDDMGRNMMWQ